jgi:ethanolamine ammonia-lyase large subunit
MALPTKIDPMLGYLTTGFQDHVRLRKKFGYRVNDPMWKFFQELEVIDSQGQPTSHFGDPLWVYLKYRRKKGDARAENEILLEGRQQVDAVRRRGVFIAQGHGQEPWDLKPELKRDIYRIYEDSKECLWAELDVKFMERIPGAVRCYTRSTNRTDYILHPATGEKLSDESVDALLRLRRQRGVKYDVQIVVSDGLNALSIMDDGHLLPYLAQLRESLQRAGLQPAPENLVFRSGRVRAGYRVGESLFGGLDGNYGIVHVIGERPGTGHRTFSAYITAARGAVWAKAGAIDHNITKVVSGIATTAHLPKPAAEETGGIVRQLMAG